MSYKKEMELTHRPLPEEDKTIESLTPALRREAAALWSARSLGEWKSTYAFRWLAGALDELGSPTFSSIVMRAAEDEERHSELCRRVAQAYHGSPLVSQREEAASKDLRDVPAALAIILYLLENCISEVIGAVTIEACLKETTAPLARAALRELLTDEVNHARIGFAFLSPPHLGSLFLPEIGRWLPELFSSMFFYWMRLGEKPLPPELRSHGCLPFEQLKELVLMALTDIALPGFASLGVDTGAAAQTLEQLKEGTHQ